MTMSLLPIVLFYVKMFLLLQIVLDKVAYKTIV